MKISKSERIYFDGKHITNGHWLCLASHIKLTGELKGLVDAGVKFARVNGFTETGDTVHIPDMMKVWPDITDVKDRFLKTNVLRELESNGKTPEFARYFVNEAGTGYLLVNERYVQGLRIDPLFLANGGTLHTSEFVVLPMRAPKTEPMIKPTAIVPNYKPAPKVEKDPNEEC